MCQITKLTDLQVFCALSEGNMYLQQFYLLSEKNVCIFVCPEEFRKKCRLKMLNIPCQLLALQNYISHGPLSWQQYFEKSLYLQ